MKPPVIERVIGTLRYFERYLNGTITAENVKEELIDGLDSRYYKPLPVHLQIRINKLLEKAQGEVNPRQHKVIEKLELLSTMVDGQLDKIKEAVLKIENNGPMSTAVFLLYERLKYVEYILIRFQQSMLNTPWQQYFKIPKVGRYAEVKLNDCARAAVSSLYHFDRYLKPHAIVDNEPKLYNASAKNLSLVLDAIADPNLPSPLNYTDDLKNLVYQVHVYRQRLQERIAEINAEERITIFNQWRLNQFQGLLDVLQNFTIKFPINYASHNVPAANNN